MSGSVLLQTARLPTVSCSQNDECWIDSLLVAFWFTSGGDCLTLFMDNQQNQWICKSILCPIGPHVSDNHQLCSWLQDLKSDAICGLPTVWGWLRHKWVILSVDAGLNLSRSLNALLKIIYSRTCDKPFWLQDSSVSFNWNSDWRFNQEFCRNIRPGHKSLQTRSTPLWNGWQANMDQISISANPPELWIACISTAIWCHCAAKSRLIPVS